MTAARSMDHALIGRSRVAASTDTNTRSSKILDRIGEELMQDGRIMRYTVAGDFSLPDTAFPVCNLWPIDALAQIHRSQIDRRQVDRSQVDRSGEERDHPANAWGRRNAVGLLSEDLDAAAARRLWDCSQPCSMAGIINSAMRLSQSWEDRW